MTLPQLDDAHSRHPALRETIAEHLFVGGILQLLWQTGVYDADVPRSGYDDKRANARPGQALAYQSDGSRKTKPGVVILRQLAGMGSLPAVLERLLFATGRSS